MKHAQYVSLEFLVSEMTIKVDGLEMKKSLLISAYNGLLVHEVFPGRKIEGLTTQKYVILLPLSLEILDNNSSQEEVKFIKIDTDSGWYKEDLCNKFGSNCIIA